MTLNAKDLKKYNRESSSIWNEVAGGFKTHQRSIGESKVEACLIKKYGGPRSFKWLSRTKENVIETYQIQICKSFREL